MKRQLVPVLVLVGWAAVSCVRADLMTPDNNGHNGRPLENSYESLRSASFSSDSRQAPSSNGPAVIPTKTMPMEAPPAYPPPAYSPPAYSPPAYPKPVYPPQPAYQAPTTFNYPGSSRTEPDSAPAPFKPAHKNQKHQQAGANGAGGRGNFSGHLRDLGKSGFDSTRRAYQEAKPALDNIKGDFGHVMNRVKSNPHIGKVMSGTKPRVMSVVHKAQPFVDRSGKRLNALATKANERIHSRFNGRKQPQSSPLAPGSVYPVPPPTVSSHYE